MALAIQTVTEEIILKIIKHAKELTNSTNLCLSGGVALNCVANQKIHESNIFENIWIQPAAGDAGGAMGCALAFHYTNNKYTPNSNFTPYLGPEYHDMEIERTLKKFNAQYEKLSEEDKVSL